MKVKPNKIKFTITKIETIEIEVSTENGFDMPESVSEIISMDNAIKTSPMDYVDNINGWEMDSVLVGDISYE